MQTSVPSELNKSSNNNSATVATAATAPRRRRRRPRNRRKQKSMNASTAAPSANATEHNQATSKDLEETFQEKTLNLTDLSR